MAQPIPVEIVEVCKVAPFTYAGANPLKSLPLTFFDIMWLRYPPGATLYYFEISTPNTTTRTSFFFDSILPKLKHSLSLTLHHYPILAGNIIWPPTSPKPAVEWAESDAVSLTVAKSVDANNFYRLSSTDNVFCKATECHSLVPNLSASHERAAILAIQITLFPSHGFTIGIAAHHAIQDGKSFFQFMKSWAYICRSLGSGDNMSSDVHYDMMLELPPELKPVFDRTSIKDPFDLGTMFSSRWLNTDGSDNNRSLLPWEASSTVQPDSVRGTFQLPRGKIEKLKRLVEKQRGDKDCGTHVSTFSVTCAYTWICLVKAEENSDNKIVVSFGLDFRSRFEPPIPSTYFGNCVCNKLATIEREALLGKEGLVAAVNTISEYIKVLDEEIRNAAKAPVLPPIDKAKTLPYRLYSIASSPRFAVYSTDFGFGKPKKVDITFIDKTGSISLMDTRNGDGGVEIGLVLRKHHMEAFASLFATGLESL